MHEEFIAHEIERVANCFVGMRNHFLNGFLIESGDVVDSIPGVGASRNAEAERKVVAFDELVSEIVTLDHSKVGDWIVTYLEFEADERCHKLGWGVVFIILCSPK